MKLSRIALGATALVILAAAAALPACSSKKSPTSPGGGGGAELGSGGISPGGSYTHRFMTAGVYGYHCSIHAVMTGSVTVDAAASASDTSKAVSIVSASAGAFTPSSVTIRPGGKVVWTNNHTTTHTVTSN